MSITTHLRQIALEERLLSTREVAAILGVTTAWVRGLITAGEIRAINLGGPERAARWHVDPEDLAAFMRARESRRRDLWAA